MIIPGESPGEAWTDIAASSYRAYFESRGMKYPAFKKLRPEIQTAIEAAVRQADAVIHEGPQAYTWEKKWKGWVAPHIGRSSENQL